MSGQSIMEAVASSSVNVYLVSSLSALISLVAIYSLVLFVKSKYSASKCNDKKNTILLCKTCEQSNLNCKIVYNKLFLRETKVNSKEEKCSNCGIRLTSSNSSIQQQRGGLKSKKYGKVEQHIQEQVVDEKQFREQDDDNLNFNIDSPTPDLLPSASVDKPKTIDDNTDKTVELGKPVSDKNVLDKKKEGTGVAFDPTSIKQQISSVDSGEPADNYIYSNYDFDDKDNNSFQTVLEVQEEDEDDDHPNDDENSDRQTEKQRVETQQGAQETRWAKSVKKVWRTQRVVELLRQAGQQVSNQVKAGKQSIVNGVNGARQQVINEFNINNNKSDVSAEAEEPEFYNSRMLRSAEIQIQQQQQHPIIFGKSKDLILVPDFIMDHHQMEDYHQQNKNYYDGAITSSIGSSSTQAAITANQTTTTRVLTDEKGHSIKIRIASPPPQRQPQLAKLHSQQKQQQLLQQQQQQQQLQHRDSIASDSPLMFDPEQALNGGQQRILCKSPELLPRSGSKRSKLRRGSSGQHKQMTNEMKASQRPQSSMARYNDNNNNDDEDDDYWHFSNSGAKAAATTSGDVGDINGSATGEGLGHQQQHEGATFTRSASVSMENKWIKFDEEEHQGRDMPITTTDEEASDENDDDDDYLGNNADAFVARQSTISGGGGPKSLTLDSATTGASGFVDVAGGGVGGEKQQQRSKSKQQRRRHSHAYLVAGGFREASSSRESEVPIEAFNDSNTSEFDDGGWDSRADTSLDFSGNQHQQAAENQMNNMNNFNESRHHSESRSSRNSLSQATGNEVMDADIRQANRLNLELMVLQNAAQNMMGNPNRVGLSQQAGVPIGGAQQIACGRSLRSKSLTGSGGPVGAGSGNSFPQSGVLPAASEFSQQAILARQQLMFNNYGSNELLAQQQNNGQSNNSASGSPMNSRKVRTTSGDQDSGYAGGLVDSRKSSLNQPFGQFPSVRIIVKPIRTPKQQPALAKQNSTGEDNHDATTSNQLKRSLLNTLASIGRSASRTSADYADSDSISENNKKGAAQEQLFEVQLVEAHNVGISGSGSGGHRSSNGTLAEMNGVNNFATASGGPKSKSRRESLLGALVAATTSSTSSGQSSPSNQRRSSIDGVYVRIFKHQASESSSATNQTIKRADSSGEQQQANHDSLSIHSSMSVMSSSAAANLTNGSDFIQTPLVKVSNSSNHGGDMNSNGSINFLELSPELREAYKFICRESEFPLRISLYQVSKRGGARYTIGHCFVSLTDWLSAPSSPMTDHHWLTQQQQQMKRFSNGSNQSGYQSDSLNNTTIGEETVVNYYGCNNINNGKYLILSKNSIAPAPTTTTCEQEDQFHAEIQLEYRLYQTILEAIK